MKLPRQLGVSLFSLSIICLCNAKSQLVDNGRVVTLGGISYYAGGIPVGSVDPAEIAKLQPTFLLDLDLFPITMIDSLKPVFTAEDYENTISNYTASDDVFQLEFLRSIYIRYEGSQKPAVDVSALNAFAGAATQLVMTSPNFSPTKLSRTIRATMRGNLPKGPYFISARTGKVYKAHRLYPDDNLTFIQGTISDENGGYLSLPAVTENVMAKSIAVPSRLYSTVTPEKPLAGLRMGVKDIFHVRGLRTSGGNRAYFYLYDHRNVTAPSIQSLIDKGAILVGKTGTVQFANGDRPTADWVDLHCPFNPRGDGYQVPSGSSSGSGAAIAAYGWLDITIGSDTGGSMRGPAGSQGIFGNRPSTGAVLLNHVIPLTPILDTAGVFSRSGKTWSAVTKSWYRDYRADYASYPKTIYRATSATSSKPAVGKLFNGFIQSLQGFLGATTTDANMTELWSETHGDAPASLNTLLDSTHGVLISHDQWNLLGKPFFEDYASIHDGRQPYVNPGPLSRWRWGQEFADESTYQAAIANKTLFKEWYETHGYGKSNQESCSEGIYVSIQNDGTPTYRDDYFLQRPGPPLQFNEGYHAIMTGTPEVVVPIGEVSYTSRISAKMEYLPVTAVLRVSRGCDLMLANLVNDLEEAGVLRSVSHGSRLY